jgi:23S rRNA (pseudouridine1915-N3)-methyltransferase
MRIRVLWFGRPAASPYEHQVETYRKRVARRWAAEDVPLRPVANGRTTDAARVLAAEAESVRRRLARGWISVALDEHGRQLDSIGFARLLEELEITSAPGVGFIVGSDLGLDRILCREARLKLSLSTMTLPHMLARLCLWEQLFRATDILGSGRYHRLGVK